MYKLFNLSNHPFDLDRFKGGNEHIRDFMKKHRLDGIELIQASQWSEDTLPADMIKGVHLRFWPVLLDLWRGDTEKLVKQFGSMEAVKNFYGGESRNAIVEYYKNELEVARQIGAEYVVLHISNVEPEHCFSYKFTYTSEEVIDAFIELVNEVFDGLEGEIKLLFENLWWPGLTLLDNNLSQRLLDGVKYAHKGFMLDISHMMNTNLELKSEEEAVDYILDILKKMGSIAGAIKGIHLNSSVTGEYVKSQFQNDNLENEKDFIKRYCEAYLHILKIDCHIPFEHPSIRRIIDAVKPEYLVYEFLCERLEELEHFIDVQNTALG